MLKINTKLDKNLNKQKKQLAEATRLSKLVDENYINKKIKENDKMLKKIDEYDTPYKYSKYLETVYTPTKNVLTECLEYINSPGKPSVTVDILEFYIKQKVDLATELFNNKRYKRYELEQQRKQNFSDRQQELYPDYLGTPSSVRSA
jgi:hypothetical protein